MKPVKEIKQWKELWSVWALILGPFVGYGVNYLSDIVANGPTGVVQAVALVILSIIGVASRLVAQKGIE